MVTTPFPHPYIAIVGRPNVGKSTLFNRLVGSRRAVVSPMHGTTRDRLYAVCEWQGTLLTFIDTGGMDFVARHGLTKAVQYQVKRALEEADQILLVCDAQEGLVPADQMIVEILRKIGKPITLVVNKTDQRVEAPPEFFSLGLAETYPVSALHGRGTGELLDHLVRHAVPPLSRTVSGGPRPETLPQTTPLAIAIIGRQNVGKSSLLNTLIREERAIVSEIPGTTRDTIDLLLTVDREVVLLVDTAGLRHRRKVKHPVDFFSMSRTLEAIRRCDVSLVLLDATQGVTRDDQRIVTQVCELGRGLVLLVNKWDLMPQTNERTLAPTIQRFLPAAMRAPVLAISAKTGFQVRRGLQLALQVGRIMRQGIDESVGLTLIRQAFRTHPPPKFRGRLIRLQDLRWFPGRPVRVELITHPAGWLSLPYQRYLMKCLYTHPPLSGVPIRLSVKTRGSR